MKRCSEGLRYTLVCWGKGTGLWHHMIHLPSDGLILSEIPALISCLFSETVVNIVLPVILVIHSCAV